MQHWIPLSLRWRARRRQQGAGGGPAALRSTSARRLARRRRTSSHSGSSYNNNSSDHSANSACVLVSRCETNALLPGLRDGPDDGILGSLDDDRGSGTPSTSSQTESSTFTPRCLHHAIAGATAGAVVEALLFPIDTIKTRLQSGNFLPSVQSGRHDSSLKAVMDSHLARQKLFHRPLAGVTPAVFLSGIGPRVVWIGVGGSIFFATLDIMEKSLLAYTTQRENDASKKVRRKQNQQQQPVTLEV